MGTSAYVLYDDKRLFSWIAKGDEAAFRVLFDRYNTRVYALSLKMTRSAPVAEEMVQEVFMNIWKHRSKLAEVENADAYIFTIAYHRLFRYLKKCSREQQALDFLLQTAADAHHDTEETLAANESRRIIDQAIQQLPPQRKAIYQLSRRDGLSHEEIADQLNISRHTVRNQLVQALKYIRDYLHKGALFLLFFLLH